MPLRILVDGYNLLYSSAWLQRGGGPKRLEAARGRLISGLAALLTEEERRTVQIVFDAAESPADLPHEMTAQGMTITFARDYRQADDLIEQIIRTHSHPKTLLVVSGDHRIGRCAKAARAQWMEAELWLKHLADRRGRNAPGELPFDKQSLLGDEGLLNSDEVRRWLQDFGLPAPQATAPQATAFTEIPSTVREPRKAPTPQKGKLRSGRKTKPVPEKPKLPSKPLSPEAKQQAKRALDAEHPPLDELLRDLDERG